MPKDMIHPSTPHPEPFVAVVGYSRDHDVQIGVQVTDRDLTIADLLFGGEGGYLTEVGQSLTQQLEGAGWVVSSPEVSGDLSNTALGQMVLEALRNARSAVERDGIWANLDRRQCNDVIRSVRKGRDLAYGRDE